VPRLIFCWSPADRRRSPIERPVLNRLPHMRRLDLLTAGEIRDRSRQLEHPVTPPRRETEPFHRGAENPRHLRRLGAMLPHFP